MAWQSLIWRTRGRGNRTIITVKRQPIIEHDLRHPPCYPVKLGEQTFSLSLADIIYDTPRGDLPHPNTMTCKLRSEDQTLFEQEYYSVGGGFIEWKGFEPPQAQNIRKRVKVDWL